MNSVQQTTWAPPLQNIHRVITPLCFVNCRDSAGFQSFCLVKFAFGSETISYPEPSQTSWAYTIRARKGLGTRLAVKEFTIIQTSSLSPPVLWRHICLLDFAARQTQAPNDLCVQSNKGNPNFTLISQMVQDSRQTNLTKRPHAKLQH